MPLSDNDLREVQGRVLRMFMDTIATVETIARQADAIYGDRAADARARPSMSTSTISCGTRRLREKNILNS